MDYAGKTALITGASSGIGLALAEEFSRRGTNLVLVARRRDRLDAARVSLSQTHGVNVTVIDLDLTRHGAVDDLRQHVEKKGIAVDFLVNNAGFGINARFAKEQRSRTQQEIALNVSVLVDLTAVYLPEMIRRDSGAIINIASTASFQPVPGMAVYGATKSFVRSFTEALWGELSDTHVRALAVSPGATQTEFFDVAGGKPAGRLVPVTDVVKATFTALDAKRPRPSVVVGRSDRLAAGLVGWMPRRFVIKTVAKMFLPKD